MKKNAWKKSELSAKERKELRNGSPAAEETAKKKPPVIALVVLIVVAVAAVFTGIFVPVYMARHYMFESNPVAVIRINVDGTPYELKYELFYGECPIAVTNFAYLASIGFFDGTVVYDTQNSRVRFGGYTARTEENGDVSLVHRSSDESFTTRYLGDFDETHYADSADDHSAIFRYALRSDTTGMKETLIPFSLNANKSGSAAGATEFQIFGNGNVGNNPDELVSGSNKRTYDVYPIGRPLNGDGETERAIAAVLSLDRSETAFNTYFRPPAGLTVTVERVEIFNFADDGAWRNQTYEYGFESFMETKYGKLSETGTTSVFLSWTKRPI